MNFNSLMMLVTIEPQLTTPQGCSTSPFCVELSQCPNIPTRQSQCCHSLSAPWHQSLADHVLSSTPQTRSFQRHHQRKQNLQDLSTKQPKFRSHLRHYLRPS